MNIRHAAAFLLALIPCAVQAQATEPPLATISYLEGPVSIAREGQGAAKVDIGDQIYDDDFISTGPGATLTFELLPQTGMKGSVTLAQKTSLYFQLDTVKGERQNRAELIVGQIGVKVKKLAGAPGFTVNTESTACGVRGTEFDVTAVPSGDVLVDCTEGEVACVSDNVTESSVPGQAVEKREGQRLGRRALAASAYADFKSKWIEDEEGAFKKNAPKTARIILSRYLDLQKKLGSAAEAMARDRDLSRWAEQRKKGELPTPAELDQLGKRIADIGRRLSQAQRLLGAMERIDARVSALGDALDRNDSAVMRTELRPGYTIGDFFAHFDDMRAKDLKRAAELRAGFKLFRSRVNAIENRKAAPQGTAP
jgi:hypothetical protein